MSPQKSPIDWNNLVGSALIAIPFVASGYAAGHYSKLWLLAAVAWFFIAGFIVSSFSDDEDESVE